MHCTCLILTQSGHRLAIAYPLPVHTRELLRSRDHLLIARIADGDPARLVPLATELIEQKPDVIVTVGSAAVRIVYSATTTIPIVAHDLDTDPAVSGLIKSLGHPGGNITGYFLASHNFG